MEIYLIIIIIIIIIICCCSSSIGGYLYTQSMPTKVQSTPSNTQSMPTKIQSTPNLLEIANCKIILKPNTCYMTKDGVYNVCSGTSPLSIEKGKKIMDIGSTGTFATGIKDEIICGDKFEEMLKKSMQ
jgi:hypothetical protein